MSRASTVLHHAVASALLFSTSVAVAFPPAAGAARLVLAAQLREGKGRRDWSASATLVLPFDRFWAPRVLGSVAAPPDTSEESDGADTSGEGDPTRRPAPDRSPSRAERPPRPRRPVALGASFVRAVVAAALRARGYGPATRRLDSLAARSRSSAALPSLWLRAARSTDASLRLSPTLSEPDRYTETGGADLWLEAKLSWDLDRLLFAPDELAVERIRDQRAAARARLVLRVLDAVFNWHRARLRARDAALLPEERFESTLEQLEAELTLDVLTGGWFSEHAGDQRARQGGGP